VTAVFLFREEGAKGRNSDPLRFSTACDIDPDILESFGILDYTLIADTDLFVDPLLLPASGHPEIARGAVQSYTGYFERLIKVLKASTATGDTYWRNADRMLTFPELKWTCLGYGGGSVGGSGWGIGRPNSATDSLKVLEPRCRRRTIRQAT
jgi:hypothetical protein